MVELNNMVRLARMAVFGITSFFALLVIILGGLVLSYTGGFTFGIFDFAALAVATGVLTLLTLPTMLTLSIVRKGAFTSMIAAEIGWTWFLWIMWLAVGGDTATGLIFFGSCSQYLKSAQAACGESSAIAAFGFLSWILLVFYDVLLFSLTFRQHLRGNTGIWTKDVTDADFTAERINTTQVGFDNKISYPNQYPPAGVVPQPTAGSYTQAGSPYPQQPQAPGLYNQPQANTGSFTHPQAQAGSPYPQV